MNVQTAETDHHRIPSKQKPLMFYERCWPDISTGFIIVLPLTEPVNETILTVVDCSTKDGPLLLPHNRLRRR